jgi:SET domain-containing protein
VVSAHPSVHVARSGIEGEGLFATSALAAGTLVLRLAGRLVSTDELDALIAAADADPDAPYVDTTTVDEDVHLVLPPRSIAHYANHSCGPNLWHDGPYDVVARRDIAAGEELTVDYATSAGAPGLRMTCACGASSCRGEVTSDDWRIPELQARYAGHWVPALARRIAAQRAT